MSGFTHLHTASGFSLRYGASHPERLVERAAGQGMRALALTDRDTLAGAIRFAKACMGAEGETEGGAWVRPIFGVDLAVTSYGEEARRAVRPRTPARGGAFVDESAPRVTAVDRAAAGQAFTALATVEELLKLWNGGGPPILRAGGLSVRELKRTATALDTTEPVTAFWLELAYGAGLLASDGETDERYAPTPAYDEWLDLSAQDRWTHLASAWLPATRVPGLVGGQDAKGRALSALGPELDRSAAPGVRARTLALLAALAPGTAPDPEALLQRLRWERPLRGAAPTAEGTDLRSRLALWTLNEAELLGITGRGALATHARALLDEGEGAAARLLAPLLPEPLDHVLLQADLTAVAPGPLERPLAETLSVLADVESKGGATVYRFTPGSVRRALDAGPVEPLLPDSPPSPFSSTS
ncbi:helicase-associated domain-containing protein, partial [Streptomyces cavourensis]|nr:helicase-associated domain-containing protein [Streptomyces cavourensis]